jgi:putative tryptophan/tyrosine transport system substrate-binding protein
MRRLLQWRAAALLAVLALGVVTLAFGAESNVPHVAVTAFADLLSFDAVRRGLEADLAGHGLQPGTGVILTFESAKGSPKEANAIATRIVADAPRVIVAISTPSAQALAQATTKIPVIFAAVSDPLAAGLVASLRAPGGNLTGVSDLSPLSLQLDLVRRILPNARTLGVVYTPAEANARRLLQLLKKSAKRRGFSLMEAKLVAGEDPKASLEALASKADALYVPTDAGAATAFANIRAAADAWRKPIFAADPALADDGALAAVGFDYERLGHHVGAMVRRVLKGESPSDIPVEELAIVEVVLNENAAAALGIALPDDVRAEADRLVAAP